MLFGANTSLAPNFRATILFLSEVMNWISILQCVRSCIVKRSFPVYFLSAPFKKITTGHR